MSLDKVQGRSGQHSVSPPSATDGVAEYLERLKAPVEFACRADGAKLAVVRNLGAFLSQCAGEGLQAPKLRSIHRDLRRLQALIEGYDGLPLETRKARLLGVRTLLEGLSRTSVGHTTQAPLARSAQPVRPVDPRSPIENLQGVGPRRAAALRRLGVEQIGDLVWMLPWRYLDLTRPAPIAALRAEEQVTVCGELRSVEAVTTPRRRFRIVRALLTDGTGVLGLKWFNQPYLQNCLAPGQRLVCFGRVRRNGLLGHAEMDNPQFEIIAAGEDGESLHTGRIVPIYHETRGLASRALRGLVDRVLRSAEGIGDECLPADLRASGRLVSKREAVWSVHFPPADADLTQYNAGTDPSHRRLAFEELFLLELGLAMRRHETLQEPGGVTFRCEPARLDAFWASLPFHPTRAQRRVVGEVLADMAAARPMNRLIQGDVGCGKTVVAAAAVWMAVGDGYQAAMMAPTELLAEQHHRQLERFLGTLGVRIAIVTSELPPRRRADVLRRLANGEIDCVVGTHALAQPDLKFARFGLAVIDEQHKFGVLQRSHLVGKGDHPDALIMTATPIPRTLALTVYGDLDVSVIDEMPAGRLPVETAWYSEARRVAVHQRVLRALEAGQQAYVVAPRIEESDDGEVQSAVELADRLQRDVFRGMRVGLLHGRLPRAEKDRVMQDFLCGAVQVLVATTVIEVGIDVPNATVMVIEHAERYGLAQLHQLRGRVGRGSQSSVCLLMSGGRVSSEARERLEAMVALHDGFLVAERDLALRGPGEFLGTRQSGLPDLKVAHLVRDSRVVEQARREAFALVDRDPHLTDPRHAGLKAALMQTWGTRLALGKIG